MQTRFALASVVVGTLACTHVQRGNGCREGLIFDSNRDGRSGVFELSDHVAEPRLLTPLTGSSDYSRVPDWSPDRCRVVFQGRRGDFEGLFVTPRGGGEAKPLDKTASGASPAWSPTGRQIAFVKKARIFLIDLQTESVETLRGIPDSSFYPAWSPDATKLAFVSKGEAAWEIFVLDIAKGQSRQLTHAPAAGASSQGPAWSPDGKRIAFDRTRGADFDIYVMDFDGANVVRLTKDIGIHARPAWSRDGRMIAFHGNQHRPSEAAPDDLRFFEIYSMRTDGAGLRRLTTNEVFDGHPDWW